MKTNLEHQARRAAEAILILRMNPEVMKLKESRTLLATATRLIRGTEFEDQLYPLDDSPEDVRMIRYRVGDFTKAAELAGITFQEKPK